jgi:spore coat polysaccharide biosynthesis predicted glycosyltransferase SpsG
MRDLIKTDFKWQMADGGCEIGIVVDAGPTLGYGHAVRCVRLAEALKAEMRVIFYPLSEDCETFLREASPTSTFRNPQSDIDFLPAVVITDLREANTITLAIQRQGVRHISIRDLGLAQSTSDVAIDGAITRIFPYPPAKDRTVCLGPQYMITRTPVERKKVTDTVLLTFGGGSTASFAYKISEKVRRLGLKPVVTRGFTGSSFMTDDEFNYAMSTCVFAISGSGVSLYDLLASGVPTIAVAFDRLQLRTADAFHEQGAVLSAGLVERVTSETLLHYGRGILDNRSLVQEMTETGKMLVDGKGLSRIVEITRRELWLSSRTETFTAC